ncbi:hypothetical protein H5410_031337 [Solanum commersonii]|uniref:Uncharacterized protein n=1 Tax=Solanum commersonii TaxID=4109 RepID=A0A9J5YJL5_SOLCO|nr:hypothetical protein H5410_031337 [Solanum commersonii]
MKQPGGKNETMMELKQARRNNETIDPEILRDLFLHAEQHRPHDTHLFVASLWYHTSSQAILFSLSPPVLHLLHAIAFTMLRGPTLQSYSSKAPTFISSTPSPMCTSPRLSAMRLGDSSSESPMLWPTPP